MLSSPPRTKFYLAANLPLEVEIASALETSAAGTLQGSRSLHITSPRLRLVTGRDTWPFNVFISFHFIFVFAQSCMSAQIVEVNFF